MSVHRSAARQAYEILSQQAGLPSKVPGRLRDLNTHLTRVAAEHPDEVAAVRDFLADRGFGSFKKAVGKTDSGPEQNPSARAEFAAKALGGKAPSSAGSTGVDASQIAAKLDGVGKIAPVADDATVVATANVILVGPPASGKGTQAKQMESKLGFRQISTGDLLRQAIKDGTALGAEAKGYMDGGSLVPDQLVIGLVKARLTSEGATGWVFDGFPRTVAQAEALTAMLQQIGAKLNKVVVLDVPDEIVISRIAGRRSCEDCGAVYHVENKPPEKEGCCDECDGKLVQRSDDTEEKVKVRLEAYGAQTADVIPYFAARGLVARVNGARSSERAFARIETLIAETEGDQPT